MTTVCHASYKFFMESSAAFIHSTISVGSRTFTLSPKLKNRVTASLGVVKLHSVYRLPPLTDGCEYCRGPHVRIMNYPQMFRCIRY